MIVLALLASGTGLKDKRLLHRHPHPVQCVAGYRGRQRRATAQPSGARRHAVHDAAAAAGAVGAARGRAQHRADHLDHDRRCAGAAGACQQSAVTIMHLLHILCDGCVLVPRYASKDTVLSLEGFKLVYIMKTFSCALQEVKGACCCVSSIGKGLPLLLPRCFLCCRRFSTSAQETALVFDMSSKNYVV